MIIGSQNFLEKEKLIVSLLNFTIFVVIFLLFKFKKTNKGYKVFKISISITILVVTIVGGYIGRFVYCTGCSMMPTFSDSGVIGFIIYKNSPILGFDELEIGDVGIFRVYDEKKEGYSLYSKRVVGKVTEKGVDTVYIKDGMIYRNDVLVENHPGCQDEDCPQRTSEKVCILCEKSCQCEDEKHGMYFVLGDNIHKSFDSRNFGLICENDAFGRLILALDIPQRKFSFHPN